MEAGTTAKMNRARSITVFVSFLLLSPLLGAGIGQSLFDGGCCFTNAYARPAIDSATKLLRQRQRIAAQQAFTDGYLRKSVQLWDQIVQSAPNDLQAKIQRDIALAAAGDIEIAHSDANNIKKMLSVAEPQAAKLSDLAKLYMLCGDYTSALSSIDRALRLSHDPQLLLSRALINYRNRQYKACLHDCEQALEQLPLEAKTQMVDAYVALGNLPQAEKLSAWLLAHQPTDRGYLLKDASLLWMLGKKEKALDLFWQADPSIKAQPGFYQNEITWLSERKLPWTHVLNQLLTLQINDQDRDSLCLVTCLFINAHYGRQGEYYARKLIKLDPQFTEAHVWLATCLAQQRRFSEAMQILNNAQKTCPEPVLVALGRLSLLQAQRQSPITKQEFAAIAALHPTTAREFVFRASMLQGAAAPGDKYMRLAVSDLTKACETGRTIETVDALIQANLRLARATESAELGLKWANRLIVVSPSVCNFWCMGNVFEHFDQPKRAVACYHQAIELDPNCGAAFYFLGHLALSEHNYSEAADELKKAVAIDPDNADWRMHLAQAYYLSGHYKQAQFEVEETNRHGYPFSWLQLRERSARYLATPLQTAMEWLSLGKANLAQQIRAVEEALQKDSTDSSDNLALRQRLADLLFVGGAYQRSLKQCDDLIATGHANYRAYSRKAAIYSALKKPQEAAIWREQAIKKCNEAL